MVSFFVDLEMQAPLFTRPGNQGFVFWLAAAKAEFQEYAQAPSRETEWSRVGQMKSVEIVPIDLLSLCEGPQSNS